MAHSGVAEEEEAIRVSLLEGGLVFTVYVKGQVFTEEEEAIQVDLLQGGLVLVIHLKGVCPVQVFKEEEEAIKVDLHEGCGRTKLFWVMALADSKTLKAMVEFRVGESEH